MPLPKTETLVGEATTETLAKIAAFLSEHHLLTLATSYENSPQCSNLFYTYLPDKQFFVVASDKDTEHMRNVLSNSHVAGSVALETKTVGKIQGVQFKGVMEKASSTDASAYLKAFPYARAMNPTLWTIRLKEMKLTDNRLGFGKKLIWTSG